MPLLSCSAVRCVYNDDKYCSKGDIHVAGDHAQEACETCCESFRERKDTETKNSAGTASSHIAVECSACNCRYNDDRECHAERIGISGANACQCSQTECGTFDCSKI